jgi:hypothetical protein
MQPTDLQRLAEQLEEEGCDRAIMAPLGHALVINHRGYLLLAEMDCLDGEGMCVLRSDAAGNLLNARRFTSDCDHDDVEAFKAEFAHNDPKAVLAWVEEWLEGLPGPQPHRRRASPAVVLQGVPARTPASSTPTPKGAPMQPTDLQRLAEQLQEEDCDRVVLARPGRAMAILHEDHLLLAELDAEGTLYIHSDAVGNLGDAKLFTPGDGDAPAEESFEEDFKTADFEEASSWLEEWLDDVS